MPEDRATSQAASPAPPLVSASAVGPLPVEPRLPNRPAPGGETPGALTREQRAWLCLLLTVGLAARSLRYGLVFPLWLDETYLAMNLIDGTRNLLEPLLNRQISPIGFLWATRNVVDLLGFREATLRLIPFLCSLASVPLFLHLARRLLSGWALVFATGWLAVSYPAIKYAAESKQYASDLLCSVLLLVLFVEWRHTRRAGWLWALSFAALPATAFSYTSLFALAACVAVTPAEIVGRRIQRAWAPWALLVATTATATAGLLWLRARQGPVLDFMQEFWDASFAPWREPWRLPLWLARSLTSEGLAFPVGSQNGGSAVTTLLVGVGVAKLWVSGRRRLVALLLLPFLAQITASALRSYPFGSESRFSLHLAPSICLLAGLGLDRALGRYPRGWVWVVRPRVLPPLRNAFAWGGLVLASFALGSMAIDLAIPYKTLTSLRERNFARWFWTEVTQEAEVVCLYRDLGFSFSPGSFEDMSQSAPYLVNQEIYSARHQRGDPPDWNAVSARHPLLIVELVVDGSTRDEQAFARWREEMEKRFEFRVLRPLPISRFPERGVRRFDHLRQYELTPRTRVAPDETDPSDPGEPSAERAPGSGSSG